MKTPLPAKYVFIPTFHKAPNSAVTQQDILPGTPPTEWQSLFNQNREKIATLNAEIARREYAIDALVYARFDLTPDETALIEQQ